MINSAILCRCFWRRRPRRNIGLAARQFARRRRDRAANSSSERKPTGNNHDKADAVRKGLRENFSGGASILIAKLQERWRRDEGTACSGNDLPRFRRNRPCHKAIVYPAVVGSQPNSAEDRDGEQAGDSRDRVVYSGRRAYVMHRHGIDDDSGQWRDGDRHAQAEKGNRKQKRHPIRAAGSRQRQQPERQRCDRRADDERNACAESAQQPTGPSRQHAHNECEGQKGRA